LQSAAYSARERPTRARGVAFIVPIQQRDFIAKICMAIETIDGDIYPDMQRIISVVRSLALLDLAHRVTR
jgi:hypothetical protein